METEQQSHIEWLKSVETTLLEFINVTNIPEVESLNTRKCDICGIKANYWGTPINDYLQPNLCEEHHRLFVSIVKKDIKEQIEIIQKGT